MSLPSLRSKDSKGLRTSEFSEKLLAKPTSKVSNIGRLAHLSVICKHITQACTLTTAWHLGQHLCQCTAQTSVIAQVHHCAYSQLAATDYRLFTPKESRVPANLAKRQSILNGGEPASVLGAFVTRVILGWCCRSEAHGNSFKCHQTVIRKPPGFTNIQSPVSTSSFWGILRDMLDSDYSQLELNPHNFSTNTFCMTWPHTDQWELSQSWDSDGGELQVNLIKDLS